MEIRLQYVTDNEGNKQSVILNMEDWQAVQNELERLQKVEQTLEQVRELLNNGQAPEASGSPQSAPVATAGTPNPSASTQQNDGLETIKLVPTNIIR